MTVAVSVEELRQATATQYSSYNATCYDDVSQHDDASSQLESDSELSLPQQKVGPHHVVHWSQWVDCCVWSQDDIPPWEAMYSFDHELHCTD